MALPSVEYTPRDPGSSVLQQIVREVEQWFSILQRKRLTVPNFDDLQDLEQKILAFIDEWNQEAAPFNWTQKSFEKTLAKVDAALKAA